jgi:hypothetical protein
MAMRSRVVPLVELGGSDVGRWRELSARAVDPNPFLDPDFLLPSARLREDARDTSLLVVDDGPDMVALMAFRPVRRPVRGIPIRMLTTGTLLLVTESERWHPLVDGRRPVEALTGMLRGMASHRLPSFLDLERIPADGPLLAALQEAAAAARMPLVERGGQDYGYLSEVVPRPPDDAGAVELRLGYLSQRTRRHYSHALRDLRARLGGELTVVDRGPDPGAMDDFLALQASGWKGDLTRGGGAFRVTGYERWFRDVTDGFRSEGRLAVFDVVVGGRTLYMSVNVRAGDGLFGIHDAFDEEFSEFSAGGLGRLAVMSGGAGATSARFFDPSMHPKYLASTALFPDRRRFVSLMVARRGILPRAFVGSIPILRRVRDRLKPGDRS